MHAASINACPIAVVLPVLCVVATVVAVRVSVIDVVAVCMLFYYVANSNRCPQLYIIRSLYIYTY